MANAVNTAIDKFNLYVEAQDITASVLNATLPNANFPFQTIVVTATNSLLNVAATATSSPTSQTIYNSGNKGLQVYINITSLTVNTVTIGVNLLGKDPVTGALVQVGRVSIDGVAANGEQQAQFYPGISGAGRDSVALPPNFAVQASLTISTTASMSGTLSYTVSGSKLF